MKHYGWGNMDEFLTLLEELQEAETPYKLCQTSEGFTVELRETAVAKDWVPIYGRDGGEA